MEEIEYKLSSNNPILILNAIRILTTRIKKYSSAIDKNQFNKHLKVLKDRCFDDNVCVCSTAVNGLLSLAEVQEDVVICTVDALLTEFLAALPNTQNLNGIIQLVFHALAKNEVKYGIMFNQHPLISILKKQFSIWPTLLISIESMVEAEGRDKTAHKILPFVIFALCNQECHEYQMLQMELLRIFEKSLDLVALNKIIMFSKPNLHRSIQYCKCLFEANPLIRSSLINCIHEMFSNNMDAAQAVYILNQHVFRSPTVNSECELSLLADCIYICPSMHIETILNICIHLLSTYNNSHVICNKIKSAVLNWKIHIQTPNISQRIDNILAIETGTSDMSSNIPSSYLMFNEKLYIAFELLKVTNTEEDLLNKLQSAPIELNVSIFNHLLGVLYGSKDRALIEKTLAVLLKCTDKNINLTSRLFPIILYKLSNSSSPHVNLALLRALTKMAVLKENISAVVTTLKTISEFSSDMQTLSMSLFYDIIHINPKCFIYLQDIFALQGKENYDEHNIAKAYILKEMCAKNFHLEVYGTELTAYLSKILNGKKNQNNALPQALAFQGLKYLCRYDIIDTSSAWYSLAPHYVSDSRGLVIKSLCELMAEAIHCSVPGPTYEKFVEDVTKKLWNYTIEYDDPIVLEAAYKAIGQFDFEQVSATMVEEYVADTTDMLFGNISGTCWMNVLLKGKKVGLPYAAEMLRSLIAAELRNYRKGTYEVHPGSGEPQYMNLPAYSILAGVASYVKKNVTSWQNNRDVYLQCLRILSIKYLKPLPPMNWCFLQELMHFPETRLYAISLATHQVILSGSARMLMDNYLHVLADISEMQPEMVHIYSIMQHLCNSIQPTVIKPFILNTLKLALTDFKENKANSEVNLRSIIDSLAGILGDVYVQDVNKSIIAKIVVGVMENLEYNEPEFTLFLKCANVLPESHLNDLSCPKQFDLLDERFLKKILTIRCSVAFHQTIGPFAYIDCFINLSVKSRKIMENMPFSDLMVLLKPVFIKHGRSDKCCRWLTELMAKIQLELADSREIDTVVCNCMIFIICVSVVSGYYIFKDDTQTFTEFTECFPYALSTLLQTELYSPYISQILEWLHDICGNKSYKHSSSKSETIINAFRAGLLSNRNTDAFKDQLKWMKYVEVVAN